MLAELLQVCGVLTWSIARDSMLTQATGETPGGHLEGPLVPSDRWVGWDSEVTTMEGIGDVSFMCSACSEVIHG